MPWILMGFSHQVKAAFGQKDTVDEIGRCGEGKNVWKGMGSSLIPGRHGCSGFYNGRIQEQWITGFTLINGTAEIPSQGWNSIPRPQLNINALV